jgi:hypothetical protein
MGWYNPEGTTGASVNFVLRISCINSNPDGSSNIPGVPYSGPPAYYASLSEFNVGCLFDETTASPPYIDELSGGMMVNTSVSNIFTQLGLVISETVPFGDDTLQDSTASISITTDGPCPLTFPIDNGNTGGNPIITPILGLSRIAIGAPALNGTGTLVINGNGFDAGTLANNSLSVNTGAVGVAYTNPPTSGTANQLSFVASTPATTPGTLFVLLTVDGVSTGNPQPFATVVANPTVTMTTTPVGQNVMAIDVTGTGFDPTGNTLVVVLTDSGSNVIPTAKPFALSTTKISVPLRAAIANAGAVSANIISYGGSSGAAVQVANAIASGPTVTAVPLTAGTILSTIREFYVLGTNLSTLASGGSLTLSSGTTTITSSASGIAYFTVSGTLAAGPLTAVATDSSGTTSGSPQVIANVVLPLRITPNAANVSQRATTLTVMGQSMAVDPPPIIAFSSGAFSAQTITNSNITFKTLTAPSAGSLTLTLTDAIAGSDAQQVATIVAASAPTITLLSPLPTVAQTAYYLTITGTGFGTITSNVTVTLNRGATVHRILPGMTDTRMIVELAILPTSTGTMTGQVATADNGLNSGTVNIATIVPSAGTPTITPASGPIYGLGPITIAGTNWSGTDSSNQVRLSAGGRAVACAIVPGSSTTTGANIILLAQPAAGPLLAWVSVNGINSAVVQIGTAVNLGASTLVAASTSVPDDGTTTTITATLLNGATPISGKLLTLHTSPSGRTGDGATGTTNGSGQFVFTVSNTVGVEVVTYTVDDTTDGVAFAGSVAISYTSPPFSTTVGITGGTIPSTLPTSGFGLLVSSRTGMTVGAPISIVSGGFTWGGTITALLLNPITIDVTFNGGGGGQPYNPGDPVT